MSSILLVDDDHAIVSGLQHLLSVEAISSAIATDVDSAVSMVSQHFYPVVLSDLRLRSEDDGLRLIEMIRQISPRSQVAAMTGFATSELESRALRSGAVTLLRKPFDFEDVLDIVRPLASDDYETIYRTTAPQLRAMIRRYKLSAEECDDILQQAWCLLLEKRGEVRNPGAWLSGTVKNLSRQAIHHNVKQRPFDAFPAEDRAYTDDSSLTLATRRALSRLDERSRVLCELIGLEQLSYAEVSERLGMPLGSIGPLYMRAKERLRRELTN